MFPMLLLVISTLYSVWPFNHLVDSLPSSTSNSANANTRGGGSSGGGGASFYGYGSRCVIIPNNFYLCRPMQYRKMMLPNFLQHTSMNDVINDSYSFNLLIGSKCHRNLRMLLCAMMAPVCVNAPKSISYSMSNAYSGSNSNLAGTSAASGSGSAGGVSSFYYSRYNKIKIRPCRELCEPVRDACTPVMEEYGYQWPVSFRCDILPSLKKGQLCLNANNSSSSSTASSTSKPRSNNLRETANAQTRITRSTGSRRLRRNRTRRCNLCRFRLRKRALFRTFCRSQAVIRGRVKQVRTSQRHGYIIKLDPKSRYIKSPILDATSIINGTRLSQLKIGSICHCKTMMPPITLPNRRRRVSRSRRNNNNNLVNSSLWRRRRRRTRRRIYLIFLMTYQNNLYVTKVVRWIRRRRFLWFMRILRKKARSPSSRFCKSPRKWRRVRYRRRRRNV